MCIAGHFNTQPVWIFESGPNWFANFTNLSQWWLWQWHEWHDCVKLSTTENIRPSTSKACMDAHAQKCHHILNDLLIAISHGKMSTREEKMSHEVKPSGIFFLKGGHFPMSNDY